MMKAQLRSLSTSVKERREEMKRNLKNAMIHTFNKHKKARIEEKKTHELINIRLRENNQLDSLNYKVKIMKYRKKSI